MSGYYNVPGQPDRGDRRKHECGCVTYFDVALWHSVAEVRCPDHTSVTTPAVPQGESND